MQPIHMVKVIIRYWNICVAFLYFQPNHSLCLMDKTTPVLAGWVQVRTYIFLLIWQSCQRKSLRLLFPYWSSTIWTDNLHQLSLPPSCTLTDQLHPALSLWPDYPLACSLPPPTTPEGMMTNTRHCADKCSDQSALSSTTVVPRYFDPTLHCIKIHCTTLH